MFATDNYQIYGISSSYEPILMCPVLSGSIKAYGILSGYAGSGSITNTASYSGSIYNEIRYDDNSSSASLLFQSYYSPSLIINKTITGTVPTYTGQTIYYYLTLTNTGTTGANAIQMIEYYPSGFVYSGYNGSGSYSSYGTTGLWTVASLLAGETAHIILYGSFDSTGMKTNTVSITGANTAYCYGSSCSASTGIMINSYAPTALTGVCTASIINTTFYT